MNADSNKDLLSSFIGISSQSTSLQISCAICLMDCENSMKMRPMHFTVERCKQNYNIS